MWRLRIGWSFGTGGVSRRCSAEIRNTTCITNGYVLLDLIVSLKNGRRRPYHVSSWMYGASPEHNGVDPF